MFAGQLPDVSFPDLLTRLSEEARLGGSYFLCQQDDTMRIAKALEQVCMCTRKPGLMRRRL